MRILQKFSLIFVLLFYFQCLFAEMPADTKQPQYSPINAKHATWVFSGLVANESGDNYGYFFQLQRDEHHFRVTAALMDESTKKVLLHEESEADLDDSMVYNWHVGQAFLKFNSINHSWIFGVKPKDNIGFNFKVDMMKQLEQEPGIHHLRSDVTMIVSQTSELDGHILIGGDSPEQFVTADDAWFRQIWQSDEDNKQHPLTSVLCTFNDGSRFYSANLHERDAQSGAIAAWFKPDGTQQSMSQFIQVSPNDRGMWQIQLQAPKMNLMLADATPASSVVAGFVEGEKRKGFCMLNHEQVNANIKIENEKTVG